MQHLNANWLNDTAPVTVIKTLMDAGHQAYFVGGCVRNALLNMDATDIDIATDAIPDQMEQIAKNAGLRVVPTGVKHGTLTFVIQDQPIEVTTFRKDISTDGRRAVVAFSNSILEDAKRRDFTMNALYADADGLIHDPLQGLQDITTRHVKFIDDPSERIQEDYLRILRFFRFHALYGNQDNGMDADALAACAMHLDGLKTLSKERIGQEMRKLLSATNPATSLAAMAQSGVLGEVLPGSQTTSIAPLIHLEETSDTAPFWMRRLLALGGKNQKDNLRLSKQEDKQLIALNTAVKEAVSPMVAGYMLGAEHGLDAMLVLSAHLSMPLSKNVQQHLQKGADAEFPIASSDLANQFDGPALGACLKRLKTAWLTSNLELTKKDLLNLIKT